MIDTLVPVLGYDWLMLFMQSHLHKSTVVLAVEILFSVLTQSADCMTKYRDGVQCAGWLDNTQQILDSDSVPHGLFGCLFVCLITLCPKMLTSKSKCSLV